MGRTPPRACAHLSSCADWPIPIVTWGTTVSNRPPYRGCAGHRRALSAVRARNPFAGVRIQPQHLTVEPPDAVECHVEVGHVADHRFQLAQSGTVDAVRGDPREVDRDVSRDTQGGGRI